MANSQLDASRAPPSTWTRMGFFSRLALLISSIVPNVGMSEVQVDDEEVGSIGASQIEVANRSHDLADGVEVLPLLRLPKFGVGGGVLDEVLRRLVGRIEPTDASRPRAPPHAITPTDRRRPWRIPLARRDSSGGS